VTLGTVRDKAGLFQYTRDKAGLFQYTRVVRNSPEIGKPPSPRSTMLPSRPNIRDCYGGGRPNPRPDGVGGPPNQQQQLELRRQPWTTTRPPVVSAHRSRQNHRPGGLPKLKKVPIQAPPATSNPVSTPTGLLIHVSVSEFSAKCSFVCR
jgi:hypothetical protein